MSILEFVKTRPPCEFCGRATDADGICTQYVDARNMQAKRQVSPPPTSVPSAGRQMED